MGIRNEKIKNNQNSKGVGKNKIQRNDLPIFTSREMATGQKIFHASGPISPASIKKSNSGPALDQDFKKNIFISLYSWPDDM